MSRVKRIYIEKKNGFNVRAKEALADFKETLGKKNLKDVRILNRYDIEGISDADFSTAVSTVFSEPAADIVYLGSYDKNEADISFAVEYLPGQYDQRADSAAQCTELLTKNNRPVVKCATIYILSGASIDDAKDIKKYVINPVDSREAQDTLPDTLAEKIADPPDVEVLHGFCSLNQQGLSRFMSENGLAMSIKDILFVQDYFKNDEKRDPTIAEIRVIDTYWSDHCRHTTFLTRLEKITFDKTADYIKEIYNEYLKSREFVYRDSQKDICLMDIATLYAKEAKKKGLMDGFDESEEINACSIKEKVVVDGQPQDYLIMFKNETHNHPTEIEPFGGAATCLGGAIRDPLSGRAYVYHAMRVTGSGDPREKIKDTMPGKLPQRKICKEAAHGYSSYGNQIGLATGLVDEIYHEGYKAKRMEIGAVVGAAPAENVIRKKPQPGDIILLLGGATGRDGCGGATGSSKAHDLQSIDACGAEVQKGNPLTERKLQRLFRNKAFSTLIKRCNDFGAGGVCVAIGELAEGVRVNLDAIRKKYEGLGGVELAISESQERMAVVIDPQDLETALHLAAEENLHADKVAEVTDEARMELFWRGKPIVSIKRSFLNTNGVTATANAHVGGMHNSKLFSEPFSGGFKDRLLTIMADLNICLKKGLIEMFDSTIGAGSINMPLGGLYQLTPIQAMAAKVASHGACDTASVFSYGFDPYIMEKNPFLGAVYSVILSLAKLTASGGDITKSWLTLQEYFERMTDEQSWGKPLSALLGAWWAQKSMGTPAIGGKDSMSGTFENMHVPPTLVSFALCTEDVDTIISPEFKQPGSCLYRVRIARDTNGMPDFDNIKKLYAKVYKGIRDKQIISAYAIDRGGAFAAIVKMALGNGIGAVINAGDIDDMTNKAYGDLIIEGDNLDFEKIGETGGDAIVFCKESISLAELRYAYEHTLSGVYPVQATAQGPIVDKLFYAKNIHVYSGEKAKPRVIIPVFPGTNCEYDSAAAFENAGGIATTFVIRNIKGNDIEYSLRHFAKLIDMSQILMIPGGFSGGDEPDGSGKFIATVLREPRVKKAVERLLLRDGLILGICNGFQALIKVGLVPYGEIREMRDDSPTLTFNIIGRHVSKAARTRITSNASPWLMQCKPGDIHTVAVSHGEGRFAATHQEALALFENGQVATQYVDELGVPTMRESNLNGSLLSVEGLLSLDGRVFGKMAHSERYTPGTLKNIPGEKDQKIFLSGVNYFL
ncbi:MAG: phosphoribosylformylglycinamidine synthase [Christensenellales bacterium]|jgi:phosphoribosylformylglycinamidine synthase